MKITDKIELLQGNCLELLKTLNDNSIDLTVTSPPYDNLRTYNDNNKHWSEQVWKDVIKDLYRITKKGGVVVWIVGDATINGSETGTSFKQALYFKEMGLKLHDTMIWTKGGFTAVGALKTRYAQVFEYMFVFVKGKLKTFNPLKDRVNKNQTGAFLKSKRLADGTMGESEKYKKRNKHGQRFNIWKLANTDRSEHPAVFPEQLAKDHILSWSNEGDIVLDCFMGSGTTGKVANQLNRNFLGIELDKDYFEIAKARINRHTKQQKLFS